MRLGWTPKGADVVITDHGCANNFRLVPPQVIRREVAAAVRRWGWRRLSRTLQEPSLAAGGFAEGILLRKGPCHPMPSAGGRGPSPPAEGAPPPRAPLQTGVPSEGCDEYTDGADDSGEETVRDRDGASPRAEALVQGGRKCTSLYHSFINVLAAAIPTLAEVRAMQVKRGERLSSGMTDVCPVCLQTPGCFYRHMWWECILTWQARHQHSRPDHILPSPESIDDPLFAYGITATPLSNVRLAPPHIGDYVRWSRATTDRRIRGTIYTDRSGLHADRAITARVGWGSVTLDSVTGQCAVALHGPLPLFTQSVGCVEI